MPDSEERIREMVRAALLEDPRVRNQVLMERAREIDEGVVEDLTLRQFHGKFRLPVSRSLSSASAAKAKPKRAPRARRTPDAPAVPDGSKQDAVRDIFRRFAVQLSKAEGRSEIVRAAARIDEFVEEVFRTLGSPDGPEPEPAPRRRRRARSAQTQEEPRSAQPRTGSDAPAADRPKASGATEETAPPARDMRRRRRPKAMLKPQPETAAQPVEDRTPAQAEPTAPDDTGRGAPEPSAAPASPLGLLHDLEEFRRRRAEREMRGRLAP